MWSAARFLLLVLFDDVAGSLIEDDDFDEHEVNVGSFVMLELFGDVSGHSKQSCQGGRGERGSRASSNGQRKSIKNGHYIHIV